MGECRLMSRTCRDRTFNQCCLPDAWIRWDYDFQPSIKTESAFLEFL